MPDPIPPESRGRVLLADDDTALSSVQARALRADGYTVVVVSNGDDAIARLQDGSFDVLLSDIQMPGLSGVDLLREVRAHDLDLPVVLMTGAPSLHTASLAVELGALKYLTKPVPLDLLLTTTAKACQLRRIGRLKREAMEVLGLRATAAGDRAGLAAGFDRMLDGLGLAFQPIVDPAAQRIVAYEALMRSEEITLPDPAAVLDAAERLDRVHDLGRRVRLLAARSLTSAPDGVLLFVNLHSRDLEDRELFDKQAPLTALAPRVVLEITERAAVGDIKEVRERVADLRELGYRVAIDDLGAGYAGLTSFAALEPEFVKLDMALIRAIHESPVRQKLVAAMASVCRDMGIAIIGEGVETVEERNTLVALGCPLHQGYLYARPGRPFPAVSWSGP